MGMNYQIVHSTPFATFSPARSSQCNQASRDTFNKYFSYKRIVMMISI